MAAQRRAAVSNVKSGRVAQRLKQRVEDGQFYEAHQTYKVLYQRYCAQGKKSAALDLLYDGASTLLRQNQWESGTDLAIMLTRHLKQEQTPVTESLLDMISELFSLYSGPREFATNIPAQFQVKIEVDPREHFMRAALKWSSVVEEGKYKYGHPSLHRLLATTFLKEKQFSKAREHFLYAGDAENFGTLLIEMAESGSEGERADVIITGAVLQLLVLRELESASGTYTTYVRNHSVLRDVQGPPYQDFPLLNFTQSLLTACQEGDVVAYKGLRQQYAMTLSTLDPTYSDYLDKIGTAFFGQPTTSSSSDGRQATNGIGGAGLMGLLGGGAGGGFLENLIGSISNSIPDPPFLQDDFIPAALTLSNGELTYPTLDVSTDQPPAAIPLVSDQVMDDDTLD